MNTSTLQITDGSRVGSRWHDIEYSKSSSDRVEAMNLHGSRVLVRTTLRDQEPTTDEGTYSIATSTSMICLNDAMVVKRWSPQVIAPRFDEEIGRDVPGRIELDVEYCLAPPTWTHLRSNNADLLRTEHNAKHPTFRWFNADEGMPDPTDEQVRAYVDGLPPPSEADSLRRELDKMRERYFEAEERVAEARAAKDDEDPWIWSDDDSAKEVGSLGNQMVVRITGGHLRGLLENATSDVRSMLLMSMKMMAMAGASDGQVSKDEFVAVARPLCEAISASSDPRIACDDRGARRTPAEVSVAIFGEENTRAMWEHAS